MLANIQSCDSGITSQTSNCIKIVFFQILTKGCEAEMGAAWIHGMNPENPITQIQTKLNLVTFTTNYDSQAVYSYATGGSFSEVEVEKAWDNYQTVRGNF